MFLIHLYQQDTSNLNTAMSAPKIKLTPNEFAFFPQSIEIKH